VFGWFPGGLAVMAVIVCAFFTTFTGASGVTILALGGLLAVILEKAGYPKRFTVGLLTASGSIGLLFPPSLPVIIYGVTSQTSIKDMFWAGSAGSFWSSWRHRHRYSRKGTPSSPVRRPGRPRPVLGCCRSRLRPLLRRDRQPPGAPPRRPLCLVVETFIKERPEGPRRGSSCAPCHHRRRPGHPGWQRLSYYVIDAQIPQKLSAWVAAAVSSKYVFLLLLNVALLVVGSLMDIYSAILVVVPLIIPLGNLFGIHPVHLGIIFLANLELGYLTPPVGLNLYLACYRFDEPIHRVYRDVLVYLLLGLIAVLLITYVPR
jgi:TRAP-type C4-dicarboxylate transport system permease large subunit